MKQALLLALLATALVSGCSSVPPAAQPVQQTAETTIQTPAPAREAPSNIYPAISPDRIELRRKSEVIATIPTVGQADTWLYEAGSWVVLVAGQPGGYNPNGKVYRIDLRAGAVHDLGGIIGPPSRLDLQADTAGHYLAWKRAAFGDRVEIIDLQSGGRRQPGGDESHLTGLHWAPAASHLAVRAAEPDSGLPMQIGAMYMDGATHIDLIDTNGLVTHLRPPQPLHLVDGPVWSQNGRWVAVTSGVVKAVGQGPGGGSEFRSTDIWLVEVAENRWVHLRSMQPGEGRLTEFPDARDLYVNP
jgi:hypothetical protein